MRRSDVESFEVVEPAARVLEPAVDARLRDAHAPQRVQAQFVGLALAQGGERRQHDAVGDARPRGRGAHRVARKPWLAHQLILAAQHSEHGGVVKLDTMTLRGAQPRRAVPAAIDFQRSGGVDVGQAPCPPLVAGDDERALYAAGARTERLDAS